MLVPRVSRFKVKVLLTTLLENCLSRVASVDRRIRAHKIIDERQAGPRLVF